MLKRSATLGSRMRDSRTGDVAPMWDVGRIFGTLRRHHTLIFKIAGGLFALALIYTALATSRYTATASLMLNARKTQVVQQGAAVVGDLQIDPGVVDSQVEVLKSESVALKVIRDLNLTEDSEFVKPGLLEVVLRPVTAVLGAIGLSSETPDSRDLAERAAVQSLAKALTIKRVGTSYVMDVNFTSINPAKASRIANAIVDAYMVGELDARFDATKRASRWLQERINELRSQATEADAAVQKFKAENNIVDTGRGLITEQQLSEINTQLTTARVNVAEVKARLDRINEIAKSDVPAASVADTLRSDVIARLRAQYLDLKAREAEWTSRFGAGHQATINLHNQAEEIARSIGTEVRRIAEATRNDYEISEARLKTLEADLAKAIGNANVTSEAQVQLRKLESTAQTYSNLYDTFLQRYLEAAQQQSFAIDDARVITAATPPLQRSWPRAIVLLPVSLILGLLLGSGVVLAREAVDDRFRTVVEVEEWTALPCIGILPAVAKPAPSPQSQPADANARILAGDIGIYRQSVNASFSRFAETLRAAKVAVDLRQLSQKTRIIGMVSALPNEGKSTVASNMAQLLANVGKRTILIDTDLRNPSLTRSLMPGARAGLIEVLSGQTREEDVIWTDPVSGLHLIPAVVKGRVSNTSELLSSGAMEQLLARLSRTYDYILLDMPPVAPVVDVRAASRLVDGFLLVIEWGRTNKSAVTEVFGQDELLRSRVIGTVLNKADPTALRRFELHMGERYDAYFREHA